MTVIDRNSFLSTYKKPVPPAIYLFGLLFLIPFIGVIAAVVLLVLGIAHYRNKLLIVFGGLGILYTIGLLSYRKHTDKQQNMIIAQSQINSIAKNIESFKQHNSQYPEKLDQISDNKYLPTNDVFRRTYFFVENLSTRHYRYKKIGDKYTLFSVGPDGRPYTADDIYPDGLLSDTSKSGLIHVTKPW